MNYDTKQINVNIIDEEVFKNIDYFQAIEMIDIDNNIDDIISCKTTSIEITDEDL